MKKICQGTLVTGLAALASGTSAAKVTLSPAQMSVSVEDNVVGDKTFDQRDVGIEDNNNTVRHAVIVQGYGLLVTALWQLVRGFIQERNVQLSKLRRTAHAQRISTIELASRLGKRALYPQ